MVIKSEYGLVVDIPDPDNMDVSERRLSRIANEDAKFEDDHYLADLYENDYIDDVLLKFKPDFGVSMKTKQKSSTSSEDDEKNENENDGTVGGEFTQRELDCLKSLPKRTYMLSKEQKFFAFAGLVDILYAYCYNLRVNLAEANVESAWTIVKLSSTLAWFDVSLDLRLKLYFPNDKTVISILSKHDWLWKSFNS